MNPAERAQARALLIQDVSLPQLIDDLERARYGDLVMQHERKGGKQLSEAIVLHEQLIESGERKAWESTIATLLAQANGPKLWGRTAGDVLNLISCDLNDELFPQCADEAAIFIGFQVATLRLALRAREDNVFRELVTSTPLAAPERGVSGRITKTIGVAISDFDAGRLSRKNLLLVLQDAIDNGDILESSNELYVVSHVMPLIDAGALTRSPAVIEFENRMNQRAIDFLRGRRGV